MGYGVMLSHYVMSDGEAITALDRRVFSRGYGFAVTHDAPA